MPGKSKQPNVLFIMADQLSIDAVSVHGCPDVNTPNIDRIADEGMIFTDYYGEQSCTAGRSSFITGQSVFRTGLSTKASCCCPFPASAKMAPIRTGPASTRSPRAWAA